VNEEGTFWKINVAEIDRRKDCVVIDAGVSIYFPNNGESIYNLEVKGCKLKMKDVPQLEGRLYTDIYSDHSCRHIEKSDHIGIIIFEPTALSERRQDLNKLRYSKSSDDTKKFLQDLNLEGTGVKMEVLPKDADSWSASRCYIHEVIACKECGGPKLAELPCKECGFHPTLVKWVAFYTTSLPTEAREFPRYWRRWNMGTSCGIMQAEMKTIQDSVTYDTARTRIRKAVTKAGRVIVGGGTHKGLYVLRPSSIEDYRLVLNSEDDEAQ
jgi:hypothetical protein